MEEKLWAKALLIGYNYLERQAKSIDKAFLRMSLGSQVTNSNDYLKKDTYTLAEKMITLTERKILLINTKILIDNILKVSSNDNAKILILKFIDGQRNEVLADLLKVSKKTIQRYTSKAIEEFTSLLEQSGYNDDKMQSMYSGERWLKEIMQRERSMEEWRQVKPVTNYKTEISDQIHQSIV